MLSVHQFKRMYQNGRICERGRTASASRHYIKDVVRGIEIAKTNRYILFHNLWSFTMIRRLFSTTAVAAVALAAAGFANAATPIKFQLDWRFEGPSALFLVPVAKGYFKDAILVPLTPL